MKNNNWFPYINIEEPLLSFHLEENYFSKKKIEGLYKWGAIDNSIPNNPIRPHNPINIGIILIRNKSNLFLKYLDNLNNKLDLSKEEDLYIKTYKGFREIYGVNTNFNPIEYIEEKEIESCSNEKDVLDLYVSKISYLKDKYNFKVLLITIPIEFEKWTEVTKKDYYFHLHDRIKLFAASKSIRTQIIRESKINNFTNIKELAKHIWWLSGAIYTKAGGLLYRLAEFEERVLYIGISYTINQAMSRKKF